VVFGKKGKAAPGDIFAQRTLDLLAKRARFLVSSFPPNNNKKKNKTLVSNQLYMVWVWGFVDGFYKEKHSLFREQRPKKTSSFCKKNKVPMPYTVRLAERLPAHTPEGVFLPTRRLSHDETEAVACACTDMALYRYGTWLVHMWDMPRSYMGHARPLSVLYCNTLHHTATHCNTLQHTATHCNTLQHTATHIDH